MARARLAKARAPSLKRAHAGRDHHALLQRRQPGLPPSTPRAPDGAGDLRRDKLSLKQISEATKELAKACRAGTINPDLLRGGSFTISNLGALGIESFTPIINPPQTGILGVDAIVQRPREINGKIELYPAMGLSLSYDHRAVDGMPASKFLADLKNTLENFLLLLAKG